jgi:hypothetical protein
VTKERRFHPERWSAVILAVGSFLVINSVDFGSCATTDEVTTCLVGSTFFSDVTPVFFAFTPLVFGPPVYLVTAVSPVWRKPFGLVGQIVIVVTSLSIVASGFAFLGWGATVGGVVAIVVGLTGAWVGVRSWRARQQAADTGSL